MPDLGYNLCTGAGVKYLTCKLLDRLDFLLHGFSTRQGGVSREPYDTLNLHAGIGDEEQNVIQNRKLFCQALGIDAQQLFGVKQVHGNRVLVVDEQLVAQGRKGRIAGPVLADALITGQPEVALTVLTADCLPIIIVAPRNKAVAMVHAGWRGTCQGIAPLALTRLTECFGGSPAECMVGMGPCIGGCCYEVGRDVVNMFSRNFSDWQDYCNNENGKWKLDLIEANRSQLLDAGVQPENISAVGWCTACNPGYFFSYRKAPQATGRMMSLVMLKA
jgi:hypothetical protein